MYANINEHFITDLCEILMIFFEVTNSNSYTFFIKDGVLNREPLCMMTWFATWDVVATLCRVAYQ